MKAFLKNYRQSPRKVRLVARLIRGKSVPMALVELALLSKRASGPIEKLVRSAEANALNLSPSINKQQLFIKEIRVDQGVTMKRNTPGARGRAFPIRKRTSHVALTLEIKDKKEKIKKVSTKKTLVS